VSENDEKMIKEAVVDGSTPSGVDDSASGVAEVHPPQALEGADPGFEQQDAAIEPEEAEALAPKGPTTSTNPQ